MKQTGNTQEWILILKLIKKGFNKLKMLQNLSRKWSDASQKALNGI